MYGNLNEAAEGKTDCYTRGIKFQWTYCNSMYVHVDTLIITNQKERQLTVQEEERELQQVCRDSKKLLKGGTVYTSY